MRLRKRDNVTIVVWLRIPFVRRWLLIGCGVRRETVTLGHLRAIGGVR